jgi:hypothetical protein
MKKICILLAISYQLLAICQNCGAQSKSPRFGIVPNDDNTGRTLTYFYYTPKDTTGADTAKFTPHGFETFIQPSDSIKDSLVINAYTTRSSICDKIEFQCVGSNAISSKGHVTFNNGFSGPDLKVAVKSQQGNHITFIFDGNAWREVAYTGGN